MPRLLHSSNKDIEEKVGLLTYSIYSRYILLHQLNNFLNSYIFSPPSLHKPKTATFKTPKIKAPPL